MSVNVETLDKLERKLILTVPSESVKFEIDKRLQKLARNVRMDGFRPGKVPMNVVAKQYHASVQQEVVNDKVGRAFYDAVTEAGLNIAGRPTINQLPVTSATEMQFEALFEVFPEVKFGDIEQTEIEKALIELADVEGCSLIVTTGGTGPAPRDVTPEATEAVCAKMLPGFGELMRAASLKFVPTAILSRQTAGIRGHSLIVNLPGKPSAIDDCLDAVFPAIPYCLDLIDGAWLESDPAVCATFRPKHAAKKGVSS